MTVNPSLAAHPNVEDWIVVRADGGVEVRTGKVEIGQGIDTAVALIVADELGVPFDRVAMTPVSTGLSPDEGYTAGSSSLEHSGHALRLAAATLRRELLARASQRLDVDATDLETGDAMVRSRQTNRTVAFAELVHDAPVTGPVDARAPRRRGARSGNPEGFEPLHVRRRVTGTLKFAHDLCPAGTLHARIVRPPHYHAVLESLPDDMQTVLGDVRLVRDGSFLAVAHDDEHMTIRGAERLSAAARWRAIRDLDEGPIGQRLLENRRESFPVRGGVARDEPVDMPPLSGAGTIRASYERPYQMHGSLAPSAALAVLNGRPLYRVDAFPGALSVAQRPGRGAGLRSRLDHGDARPRIRMLRAQRCRRRCARGGARRPRHSRTSRAAEVVARGRTRLGTLRFRDADGTVRPLGARRHGRGLVARDLQRYSPDARLAGP